jgi:membrane fusion protein
LRKGYGLTSLIRKEVLEHKNSRLKGSVVLVQPSFIRHLTILISAILIVAITYLTTATYSRTESSEGYLYPKGDILNISAPISGVVKQLTIREGDNIASGELIAIIENDITMKNGAEYNSFKVQELKQQLALLKKAFVSEKELNSQNALNIEIQQGALKDRLDLNSDKLTNIRERISLHELTIKQIGSLAIKGFVSEIEISSQKDKLLSLQQDLINIKETIADTKEQIQLNEVASSTQQTLHNTKLEELNKLKSNLEIEIATSEKSKRANLKSLYSGVVGSLSVRNGDFVEKGKSLYSVLPPNAELLANLYVSADAITNIRKGMVVKLKYAAFPFERFGTFSGQVVNISEDVVFPINTRIPNAFNNPSYRVQVKLPSQTVSAFNNEKTLKLGMKVSAAIVLEEVTFLEWLFEPLYAISTEKAAG